RKQPAGDRVGSRRRRAGRTALCVVCERVGETGSKFSDHLGGLLLVWLLTGFAAKLIVEIPSAQEPKWCAAIIASGLHGVSDFRAIQRRTNFVGSTDTTCTVLFDTRAG